MAVAFGSIVNVTPGTGTNTGASPSITTPASNPVVVVSVGLASAATVTSLTITGFGGTAAQVATITATGGATVRTSVWEITAPTANTAGTVQANLSANIAFQMSVATFSGADQTDPCPTADAQTHSSFDTTLTPTNLTANDASFGAFSNGEAQDLNAITPNSRYLNNTTAVNHASGNALGTSGIGFTTTIGQVTAKVAVRVKEATAAAPELLGQAVL